MKQTLCWMAALTMIIAAHYPREVFASSYTEYLCTIYPPECPKISKSGSLESTHLTLATGLKGRDPKSEKRRVVSFDIPRAFIDWKPYLKDEPQSQFKIEAALPDLLPYTLWESIAHDHAKRNLRLFGKKTSQLDLRKHWLSIELSITYQVDYKQCTESECFDTPIEMGLNGDRARTYTTIKPVWDDSFDRYLPVETPAGIYKNQELLVPKVYEPKQPIYLICDVDRMPTYNWCDVNTMYDKNIILRYKFEAAYLKRFPRIDEQVRSFVKSLIIKDVTTNIER